MKYKKIIILSFLAISFGMIAKNKERVEFTNDYPDDVTINFIWKNQSFPYNLSYQDALLPQGARSQIVAAPTSKHRLLSIGVSPAMTIPGGEIINLLGNTAIGAAAIGAGGAAGGVVLGVNIAFGGGVPDGVALGAAAAATAAAGTGIILSGISLGVSSLAKEIHRSSNFKKAHPHGNRYFIIEKAHPDKNQINIKGYKSKEAYDQEFIKNQEV